jgi:hypothetical protein
LYRNKGEGSENLDWNKRNSYRVQNLEQEEQRRGRGIRTLSRNKDETQRTEPCRATKEQNIGETQVTKL